MNPAAAQKVFDALTNAELAYQLNGTPHAEFLRKQAWGHLGSARRVLLQISELPDLPARMGTFLKEFEDDSPHQ